MDTKSKKYKRYSPKLKITAVILILICTICSYFVGITLIDIKYDGRMSPLVYDNYFHTVTFSDQYSQLVRDVVNVNLVYKSEENVKEGKALNKPLVLQKFAQERGLNVSTLFEIAGYRLSDINYELYDNTYESYENTVVYGSAENLVEELKIKDQTAIDQVANASQEYKICKEIYEKDYPIYERRVIQGQLNDFRNSKAELESYRNFVYYLYNEKEKNIIQNEDQEVILNQDIFTTIEGPYVDGQYVASNNDYIYYDENGRMAEYYYYDNYQESIETILQENGYFLNVAVMQPLQPGDNFYTQYQNFSMYERIVPETLTIIFVCCIIILLLIAYLISVTGQKEKNGEIQFCTVDKIYNDVQTVFVALAGAASVFLAMGMLYSLYFAQGEENMWQTILKGALCLLLAADMSIGLSYILSMARQWKAKQLLKNTLISTTIRKLGSLFSSKTFNGWLLFCMFIYAGANILLFILIMAASWDFIPFLITLGVFIGFNIICAALLLRALSSLAKIMVAVKETSKGNLNYALDINEISPSFINFATDVAGMQIGLKGAVKEAVKGERMKTDLITNVSHDLKTPLTSIITYVDLLKKEKVENQVAEGYINILVDKSYRLKQLIEDLIEASKASSGNLTVATEKLDLRQLVMQACGEFEEKIKAVGLDFRISSAEETFICADGKHMWRIAENLISNAIKYSMPNSRVYIDIIKTKTTGTLVIKNISEQPIEVVPDQLTERFVRGDVSRTTEGSGLGLSIAKSLTALQGGSMEINIDGDLFKVSIKMPLWEEETEKENNKMDSDSKPSGSRLSLKKEGSETEQKEKKPIFKRIRKQSETKGL